MKMVRAPVELVLWLHMLFTVLTLYSAFARGRNGHSHYRHESQIAVAGKSDVLFADERMPMAWGAWQRMKEIRRRIVGRTDPKTYGIAEHVSSTGKRRS